MSSQNTPRYKPDTASEVQHRKRLEDHRALGELSAEIPDTEGFDFLTNMYVSADLFSREDTTFFCDTVFILGIHALNLKRFIADRVLKPLGYEPIHERFNPSSPFFCSVYGNPKAPLSVLCLSNTLNVQHANSYILTEPEIVNWRGLDTHRITSGAEAFAIGTLVERVSAKQATLFSFDAVKGFDSSTASSAYKLPPRMIPRDITQNVQSAVITSMIYPAPYKSLQSTITSMPYFIDSTVRIRQGAALITTSHYARLGAPYEISQTFMTVKFFQHICKMVGNLIIKKKFGERYSSNDSSITFEVTDYDELKSYLPYLNHLMQNCYEHLRNPTTQYEPHYAYIPMRFDISNAETRFALFCLCNVVSILKGYKPFYNIDTKTKTVSVDFQNRKARLNQKKKDLGDIGFRIPEAFELRNLTANLQTAIGEAVVDQSNLREEFYTNRTHTKPSTQVNDAIPYKKQRLTSTPSDLPTHWNLDYQLIDQEFPTPIHIYDTYDGIGLQEVVSICGEVELTQDVYAKAYATYDFVERGLQTSCPLIGERRITSDVYTDFPNDGLIPMSFSGSESTHTAQAMSSVKLATEKFSPNYFVVGLRLIRGF